MNSIDRHCKWLIYPVFEVSCGTPRTTGGKKFKLQDPDMIKYEWVAENRLVTVCDDEDKYRFGFNGQMKDNEIAGTGNSLDFGNRMFNPRLGKFLSLDRYANKYSSLSAYSYAANSPINAIDVNGDYVYIIAQTVGNDRGYEMFASAALTRQRNIEKSPGFDPKRDKVVTVLVTDLAVMGKQIDAVTKFYSPHYGTTKEFSMFSHGAMDGPDGTTSTGSDRVDNGDGRLQMTQAGWAKINFNWSGDGDKAIFFGCRTGATVDDGGKKQTSWGTKTSSLSNFKNVKVWGQTTRTWPSIYTDTRTTSWNQWKEHYGKVNETYMVGGERGTLNAAGAVIGSPDANPMRVSENGTGDVGGYQPGTSTPQAVKEPMSVPMKHVD